MANAKSIRDEFQTLTELVHELRSFADLSIDLAGIDPDAPSWPWLVGQMIRRVETAAHRVEDSVRRHALPLLDDMSNLTK
jgi:hypothetical protein